MIYSKNEAFCDTSHHQVIYTMLKLKSWIRVKKFYIQLKRTENIKIYIVMLHRFWKALTHHYLVVH